MLQLKENKDNNSSQGENGQKKKKKRRKKIRKIVHRTITPLEKQAEENKKKVDEKIFEELAIPLSNDYGGPQFDLRWVMAKNLQKVNEPIQLRDMWGKNWSLNS